MKKDHLVSVIIPCFNAKNYLEECIKSVLAQTYQNVEIIIVDDGSVDDSFTIAEELASINERVIVLRHPNGENKGVSVTRQLGIERAKGDFISFLDADDIFEPEKIKLQVAQLEKEPESVLSHTGVFAMANNDGDITLFEKSFQ